MGREYIWQKKQLTTTKFAYMTRQILEVPDSIHIPKNHTNVTDCRIGRFAS